MHYSNNACNPFVRAISSDRVWSSPQIYLGLTRVFSGLAIAANYLRYLKMIICQMAGRVGSGKSDSRGVG
ncbi:hypothetical protein EKN67_10635 [Enterobacter hormaechei]|nr:hypothetical protein EKN67_10635 [Enterobacter hormaechei]